MYKINIKEGNKTCEEESFILPQTNCLRAFNLRWQHKKHL